MKHEKFSRTWQLRVADILNSIDKIAYYLDGITFNEFRKNQLIIDAVIRNIEIMGEASKAIPPVVQNRYPDIPWREMNGMRNILIHEYFGVEASIVWHTAKKQLPLLKKLLENIPLG